MQIKWNSVEEGFKLISNCLVLLMLTGFGISYHTTPLENFLKVLRYTSSTHYILRFSKLSKRQADKKTPLDHWVVRQKRKIILCMALRGKRYEDHKDCLRDKKITWEKTACFNFRSLISFTERQLCYTAQRVNSFTFFTPPLSQSNYLKANKY